MLKEKGIKVNNISKNELHILTYAHYSAIYEIIEDDMTKNEAFEYLYTITKFFVAGWSSILDIQISE